MKQMVFQPIAKTLRDSQNDRERVRNVAGDYFELTGFIDTENAGEGYVTVNFPLRFFEKPCFTSGFELANNEIFRPGSFPTCSGAVASWVFGNRADTGAAYYVGATLIIVVTGEVNMKGTFHYKFTGPALVGTQGAVQ